MARGFKKNGPQSIGKSRGGWNTKIHMVAADARTAVTFCLSSGHALDAPTGRRLIESLGQTSRPVHLLVDRAYEGNETRQLALDLGSISVVPPSRKRLDPWEYDRAMYLGFLSFVLVADGLRALFGLLLHVLILPLFGPSNHPGPHGGLNTIPGCLILGFDGAIISLEWKEALWARFVTAVPPRQGAIR